MSILVDGVIAGKCCATFNSHFYCLQTKYANVIFLQMSVRPQGVSVWHDRGLCITFWGCIAGGMCGWGSVHGRGHVWQGGMHGRGGMHGGGHTWQGGMHGRGHAWQGGKGWGGGLAGGAHERGHAWQERCPLQRAVCILIECIFVCSRQGSFKCCRLFANKLLLALENIGLKIHECFPMTLTITGRARLIRSQSSARFYFELSGNSN